MKGGGGGGEGSDFYVFKYSLFIMMFVHIPRLLKNAIHDRPFLPAPAPLLP